MKLFIAILILVSSMPASGASPVISSGTKLLQKYKDSMPILTSCTEQLQDIFEECDARHKFLVIAEDYLADTSPKKQYVREVSVFQALAKNDTAKIRDVFRIRMNVITDLWLMKHFNEVLDVEISYKQQLLHQYLITELFDEHKLPFEILYPRITESVSLPFFYFGKTLRAIYEDAAYQERSVYEEKKQELGVRMVSAEAAERLFLQQEYLALIQQYYSQEAYNTRVSLTAEHIAGYASRLMDAGNRIDLACESLLK